MQIMPPRLQGLHAPRALSIRSRPVSQRNWTISASNGLARQGKHYSDAREKPAEQTHNMHVSEEAAATSKTKGEPGPELSQGTPIADVVQGDKKAQENLPKAVKENIQNSKPSDARSYSTMASRRTFSTSARAREGLDASAGPPPPSSAPDPSLVQSMLQGDMFQAAPKGPLAIRGKARSRHFHERYQNIVEQFVGLIMRDGKKAAAQRNVALILAHLRTAPPPKLDSTRLIPGHPPPSHLALNPVMYLTLAVDSVAPILRIKQIKGAAGGGKALPVPVPLSLRRRRWEAIHWILGAANKRKGRGSGTGMLAQKVADEIIAVVEGKSGAWATREGLHKQAVVARANILVKRR